MERNTSMVTITALVLLSGVLVSCRNSEFRSDPNIPNGAVWIAPAGRFERYFIVNGCQTFAEAAAICAVYDAFLADFHTKEELTAFGAALPPYITGSNKHHVYIGGHRNPLFPTTFLWLSDFSPVEPWWATGQPDDGPAGIEDCLSVDIHEALFNDINCDKMYPNDWLTCTSLWGFLCEVKLD